MRTYKYRLYPTPEQEAVMHQILGIACWLYNRSLAYRRKRWSESRHSVSYYEGAGMWRDWRNEEPAKNPLRLLNMTAGQQVLRRLNRAYSAFFKAQRGKPRFKRPNRFNSVNFKPGDGANLKARRLYLQNVGLVIVRWHRDLPVGALKDIILLRKPSGWSVCLQMEMTELNPEPHPGPAVGIDAGLYHALALSNGRVIDSPKYLEQSLTRLRYSQRKLARRKKGSARWWKAVLQVRKQQEHVANQRRDWWHKVTRQLVDTYGVIVLEDLDLNFMLRNNNLARAAHDVSLGIFRKLLDYKALDAGVEVITVSPAYTSQVCSVCDRMVEKKLCIRLHSCPVCGFTCDRDVNAALNILSAGTRRSGANVGRWAERSLRSSAI